MKKVYTVIVLLANFYFTSCQSQDPEEVVRDAMNCLIEQNYREYVDYFYIENENVSDINEQKNLVADFLQKQLEPTFKQMGGLKSCKILDSSINGNLAVVNNELSVGNGTTMPGDPLQLKPNSKKQWRLLLNSGCKWNDLVKITKLANACLNKSVISNQNTETAVSQNVDTAEEENSSTLDVAEIIQQYIYAGQNPSWGVFNNNKSLTALSNGLE